MMRKAVSEAPEAMLLDLMLPDLDGLDVCRQIKNIPVTRHIPVIMPTGKGEDADIATGLELGA